MVCSLWLPWAMFHGRVCLPQPFFSHAMPFRMLAAKIIFHCIEELISIGSAEAIPGECLGWLGWGRPNRAIFHVEIGWKHHGDEIMDISLEYHKRIISIPDSDWLIKIDQGGVVKWYLPNPAAAGAYQSELELKHGLTGLSIYLSVYDSGKGNMTIPSHGV